MLPWQHLSRKDCPYLSISFSSLLLTSFSIFHFQLVDSQSKPKSRAASMQNSPKSEHEIPARSAPNVCNEIKKKKNHFRVFFYLFTYFCIYFCEKLINLAVWWHAKGPNQCQCWEELNGKLGLVGWVLWTGTRALVMSSVWSGWHVRRSWALKAVINF